MSWKTLIALLKRKGYEGPDDDLAKVQAFIEEQECDGIIVEGELVDIDKLFEDRPTKDALDLSDEARKAEVEKEVDDRFQDLLDRTGLKKKAKPAEGDEHEHATKDVKVGKDRLEDDPCLGYPPYEEGGFGFFLFDVAKATVAMEGANPKDVPERLTKCQLIMEQKAPAGMSEQISGDGGFLVPVEQRRELMKKVYDTGAVFTRARNVMMGSRVMEIPYIVESSRVDGSRHGGVRGYWTGEAASLTKSKPKGDKLRMEAHKLTALGYVTDELEEDGDIGALQLLAELFAEELRFKLDDGFINGTGAGQPQGILNAAAVVQVTRATASRVEGIDVVKMWARAFGRGRQRSVWFINQDIEPDLHTMAVLPIGGGAGDRRPVYMPASGVSGRPFATLFNVPVIPIEQCATLGTAGDIILADMTQYLYGQRGGLKSAQSIHVNFLTDETAFKVRLRADGQSWWQAALTPFKGSNTQSPFITLN